MLELTPALVFKLDPTGCIEYLSEPVLETLGYRRGRLVGEPIDILFGSGDVTIGDDVLSPAGFADRLLADRLNGELIQFFDNADEAVVVRLSSRTIEVDEEFDGVLLVGQPLSEERIAALERKSEQFELFNQIFRHDIRNDATLLLEVLSRLRRSVDEHDALTEAEETLLDRIGESGERIVEMTERSRDLIQTLDTIGERTAPIDLRPLLRREIAKASTIRESTIDVPDAIPDVEVFATEMLASVFRNVLVNALEHARHADPNVEVTVTSTTDTVTVSVADDGPGISQHVASAVERGELSLENRPTDGFGLYIVQTLVDQYDGSIRVEGNDPTGTIVHITLRRAGQ